MIRGRVARHTIQRERPIVVADDRGGEEHDFSNAVKLDLHGWALDSGTTVEDLQNRDGVEITWTIRGPFDADIERHDRITVLGEMFRIEGGVRRQPGASPRTSHTILALSRWEK